MLHYETVEPRTLALLKRLMRMEALADHALVGGTALSLRYGHRISVDLDLFTDDPMDTETIKRALADEFGDSLTYLEDQQAKWAIFGFIDDIKVDIIHIPHARIADLVIEDGLRMYSDDDIGPMKVQAILHRAQKKDFWDIEKLLEVHGVDKLLKDHRKKYSKNIYAISLPRALNYFVDAEDSEAPVCLKDRTWEEIKDSIGKISNGYL